jgi:hypothetical protein
VLPGGHTCCLAIYASVPISFALDLLLQARDPLLLGWVIGAPLGLEGCGSILEELLLPTREHRRLQPQFVTGAWRSAPSPANDVSGWRHLFARAVLPCLLHVLSVILTIERFLPLPAEVEQFDQHVLRGRHGAGEKARRGYSRDSLPDCAQVVIALIVTPDGFPLAYEVMDGNASDQKTLKPLLDHIEKTYGQAKRVWVMDRGIPTEATLAQMRERNISHLVGTPKGRINKDERSG